jgi:hypothetical protein
MSESIVTLSPAARSEARKRSDVPMGARRISVGSEADCAVCGSTIEEPRGNTRVAERKVFQSEAARNRPCKPAMGEVRADRFA